MVTRRRSPRSITSFNLGFKAGLYQLSQLSHSSQCHLFSEPASENLTSVECLNLLTTIYRISSFMLLQMFIGFLNSLYRDDAVTIPP